jgi:hypothetical protein
MLLAFGILPGADPLPPSPPAEKATASHEQTRQACPDNRAGHGKTDSHRSGVASLTAECVRNEDVPKTIRGGQVSNHRVSNGEVQVAADPKIPVPAGGAADPETERPCAVPAEASTRTEVCLQRLSCKRLNDADVPYHNASSVEFEELEVRLPPCAHPTVFGGPLARSTTICTFAPTWVTPTVPNGAVPQPPVQWSDVKSKTTA